MAIPFSILDLAPIVEGGTAAGALQNTLDFARHAERYGYHRYWLAEHHNMPGVASAATAVVIAHVAGGTRSIRVGSGGIMLPNHAPLIVAERFGTLETLYPGRIDLGLGRAPGTDRLTSRAFATGSGNQRRSICGGCARIATFLRNCGSGAGGPGDSRSGPERPTLYPGIECVRGIGGSNARLALCVRIAFRAGCSEGRARSLPRSLQAFPPIGTAVRDGRSQCRRRRAGGRSTASVHLSPADVLVHSSRQSGCITATRGRSQTRGERSGDRSHKSYVHVLVCRHAGDGNE